MTRHRWRTRLPLAAAIVLLVGPVAWYFGAYYRGMIAAHIDHARGHHEIQMYGLPEPGDWEAARLLRERYGVETNVVAGCVVTQKLVWFADGYNEVAWSRLQAKFGKDIFAEYHSDAEAAQLGPRKE